MKAFYCLWPNFKYMDKLVDSGIDTILLCAHNLPWDGNVNTYYDSKRTFLSVIERYRNSVDIVLMPLWMRSWVILPEEQRWVTPGGNMMPYQPCPLSKKYIDKRIKDVVFYADGHNMKGIIWDLEHMAHDGKDNEIILYYKEFWKPKHRCHCKRCSGKSTKEIWNQHSNMIKSGLSGRYNINGELPYTGGWIIKSYPKPLYHLTEETYMKDISCWENWKWKISFYFNNVDPKIVPGAWAEYFSEESYINYLKKLKKKYDGFWIYSHETFGNKIPNPHIKYPYPGPMSNNFFEMLKKI